VPLGEAERLVCRVVMACWRRVASVGGLGGGGTWGLRTVVRKILVVAIVGLIFSFFGGM